ncbi:hypothetical protein DICPUDRAFT_87052 [Dictyostelium purpureum]|uniref:Type A von Willebrand factor domain-containing protein n=1 Tax=Dictyostelium purpureum TaxID=5786 RepID=F0ZFM5_DICPU|nr:uncharacterized protein DICPUDRAFT_87052 [Dictyostelium purpureum]EGC37257.1 hypothetical protein DICPUDRAFT_87052 [Dictyostelium purpureum]|eukprot:XP_003286227.1 hypothetical protein DICPUDRAFT_87052 [Dictyostelium purpureum]
MKSLFKIFIVLMAMLFVAEASHFRFGSISWQPTTSYNTIKFSSNFAFRTTFFKSSKTSIVLGESISVGTLTYGTGSGIASNSVVLTVTGFDPINDWFTGSYTVTKTYPVLASGASKTYTAIFTDCCRISSLINNKDGSWNITTNVQIENKSDLSLLNSSPVSSMLPIYNVIYGKNNNFRIIASDPNNDPLTFSFSTVYTMTQPAGMTISPSGDVFFKPTQIGLYSTQIYIQDSKSAYIVVDFILNSVSEPGVCDDSCVNKGIVCTTNSQCTNCNPAIVNNVNNTCVVTINEPPYFTNPTPVDGQVITFNTKVSTSFAINCTSDKSTVVVQSANVPKDMAQVVNPISGNSRNQIVTYSWTPKVTDVGSYVMSAYCSDAKDLSSQVRSFSIFVPKPNCGAGEQNNNGGCTCPTGWNPDVKCFDCSKGYYGPDCVPSDKCINGNSYDGVNGDGKCSCYNGWTGVLCDTPLSRTCSDLTNSIIATTVTPNSYINPTFVSLYVKDQTEVKVSYSIPASLPTLNVYVLADANAQDSTVFGYIKSNMNSFVSSFKKFSENAQFGLGFFSDVPNAGFTFQPQLTIGSAIDTGISTLNPNTYVSASNGNSLASLIDAASSPLGWTTGAYRVIVLITDSDHTASSADIEKLKTTLAQQSIMPIIVGYNNAVLPNWSSTISSAGFGVVAEKAGIAADWTLKAQAAFTTALKTIVFKAVAGDDEQVISTVPNKITVNTGSITQGTASGLLIKIPASTDGLASSPTPRVSAIGYGAVDLRVNYNRKPFASAIGFACDQNGKVNFKLAGSDPDSNILTFKFKTLPAGGIISANNANVNTATQYASDTLFTFSASTNYIQPSSFSFIANDGCLDSDQNTGSITINRVNQAPTCSPQIITSKGLGAATPVTFTLSGSDFEDSSSKLYTIFPSLSDISAYGVFKTKTGATITATTQNIVGNEISFTQTSNIDIPKAFIVNFAVFDSSNLPSSYCSLTVNVIHTNVAPIATGSTPVSIIPLGIARLNLNATDSDSKSVSFTITAFSAGVDGSFYECDTPGTALIVNKVFGPVDVTSGKASLNQKICYLAPETTGSSYASISYTTTDFEGLKSANTFTTLIDIVGQRLNIAPEVLQTPPFQVYQEEVSEVITIDGTDADPSDKGKLIAVISTPPANGVFVSAKTNGNAVTQGLAPLKFYYKPNKGFYGTDSFSYYVYDTFNSQSGIATTQITVNRVNHAPILTLTNKKYTSNDQFPVSVLISVRDDENDPVTCSFVGKLPGNYTILDSGKEYVLGAPLSSPIFQLTIDPAKVTPKPYENIFDTLNIECIDTPKYTYPKALSASGSFVVYYDYFNTKPKTNSFQIRLNQDDQVSFVVNGSDLESPVSDLKVSLLSLPTNGKLLYKNVEIENTSASYYLLDGLTYKPNKGMSDYDTQYLPLDRFNFAVIDGKSLASEPAVGEFNVNPRNPPIYTGLRVINVYQNTRYPLTITGVPGNGGVEVNLKVTGFTGRGNLSVSHIMGSEKPIDSLISTYPVDLAGSNSYNLAYMPPRNKYGDNFDTITFQLYDRDIISGYITIIVNVIHVNQPPTITPIGYTPSDSGNVETLFIGKDYTVNMNVDTNVTIKFDGNDVDEPVIPLQALMPVLPTQGTVRLLNGEVLSPLQNITQHTDGHYYIVFEPSPGAAYPRYTSVPLFIKDEYGLSSEATKIFINVNRVNIPPYVTVEDQYQNYTFNTKDIVNLKGIVATDPDSVNNNITLIVSVVGTKNESALHKSFVSFNLTNSPSCTFEANYTTATCLATNPTVLKIVQSISVQGYIAGDYRLKIFVNDMGYNAPQEIRSQSFLNATNYVYLTVKNANTTNKSNKTILSVAIAAAAAATAIIASAIWKLVKKAAPPTDAFFGEGAWSGDGVSTNPLYENNHNNSGVNPLYESGVDA